MIVEFVYKTCVIKIGKIKLLADLILLDLQNFDVILGMHWLATYYAKVDFYIKEVTINILNQSEFVLKGIWIFSKMIPVLRVERLL